MAKTVVQDASWNSPHAMAIFRLGRSVSPDGNDGAFIMISSPDRDSCYTCFTMIVDSAEEIPEGRYQR